MPKKKSKQVPLVIYKGGERIEIGMASVSTDGSIEAQIKKDIREDIKEMIYADIGDFSINPKTPPSLFYNNVRVVKEPLGIHHVTQPDI